MVIGSGRLRSYQMMQAAHGVWISGMGMCTATASTTTAMCVASGRPWFLFGYLAEASWTLRFVFELTPALELIPRPLPLKKRTVSG